MRLSTSTNPPADTNRQDTISVKQALSGGDGNDELYGGNNNDTIYGNAGHDWLYEDPTNDSGKDVMGGGAGNDTMQAGAEDDTYIYTFYADGQDHIYNSQSDYDLLRINGVNNGNDLIFTTADAIGHSANNLLICTVADAADGMLNEFIEIHSFYSSGSYGAGRIEIINVNGTNYYL